MNVLRKWIRNVFGFSGNEINGFLILLPLMALLILSEPLYRGWVTTRERTFTKDTEELDSLVATWGPLRKEAKTPSVQEVSLFSFDPNTSTVEEFRRLGFTEISATRIAAYRHKGGVFRIKSDLMNIYGLDSTLYHQLYDYIRLPSRRFSGRDKAYKKPLHGSLENKQANKKFDINIADTLELKAVYGIGSKLAARIVKFRDGLGGFVRPEQLFEVYGLDSMVVSRLLKVSFIKSDFIPEKININTSDEKQLSGHPYIRYKIARILIRYRFQHGDFIEVNDIKKLSGLQPQEVERLLPYIKVEDR